MQLSFCIVKENFVSGFYFCLPDTNNKLIIFQCFFQTLISLPRKPQGKTKFQPRLLPCGHSNLRACALLCFRNHGCFPLCQRFRKFRSEFKWKGPFRFLPTGIFGITSGGGSLISVGIFRSNFAVPFLTNRFFALIREFGNHKKWQELFLLVGAV